MATYKVWVTWYAIDQCLCVHSFDHIFLCAMFALLFHIDVRKINGRGNSTAIHEEVYKHGKLAKDKLFPEMGSNKGF